MNTFCFLFIGMLSNYFNVVVGSSQEYGIHLGAQWIDLTISCYYPWEMQVRPTLFMNKDPELMQYK